MQTNANEIHAYLDAMHGTALVQVEFLQDGFVTGGLPDAPCADFAVADGALAWCHGAYRPHGIYAQHVQRQDDNLVIWHEFADTGYGWRVSLSPLWLPEQFAAVAAWLPEREAMLDKLRQRLLEHCVITKQSAMKRNAAVHVDHTYLVAGVDRASNQVQGDAGLELRTVGALVVAADGSEFQFVGLPYVADDAGMSDEFEARAQLAAQTGVGWLDLFNYVLASGNGYTSDYSVAEPVQAPSAMRAGYRWLRKRMARRAPHLVV